MQEPLFFESASLKGKRVLIRCDFNVPLNKDGTIETDTRIRASIPIIHYVSSTGAKTILMGHLGNPHGKRKAGLSMKPVGKHIAKLLGKPVRVLDNCVGRLIRKTIDQMSDGDIVLLENLRFNSGEEKNDSAFARQLSELGDIYIDDAFGSEYQYCYKYHASVDKIKTFFIQPTYRLCFS